MLKKNKEEMRSLRSMTGLKTFFLIIMLLFFCFSLISFVFAKEFISAEEVYNIVWNLPELLEYQRPDAVHSGYRTGGGIEEWPTEDSPFYKVMFRVFKKREVAPGETVSEDYIAKNFYLDAITGRIISEQEVQGRIEEIAQEKEIREFNEQEKKEVEGTINKLWQMRDLQRAYYLIHSKYAQDSQTLIPTYDFLPKEEKWFFNLNSDDNSFVITAIRATGLYQDKTITINREGNIYGNHPLIPSDIHKPKWLGDEISLQAQKLAVPVNDICKTKDDVDKFRGKYVKLIGFYRYIAGKTSIAQVELEDSIRVVIKYGPSLEEAEKFNNKKVVVVGKIAGPEDFIAGNQYYIGDHLVDIRSIEFFDK